jgi:hypothetical protein
MTKKLNWLDKFAEEQMKKIASLKKKAEGTEDVIVNPEDVPGATDGETVEYNGETFEVINANYSDEFGPGVVLRSASVYDDLAGDPMAVSMGVPNGTVTPGLKSQEYARSEMNTTQQTYTFDEDAQWGSSSVQATEQQIASDNAIDRTTVPGKFTPSQPLNNVEPVNEVNSVEDVQPEQVSVEEVSIENVDEEQVQDFEEVVEQETFEDENEETVEQKTDNRIINRMLSKK